MLAYDRDDAVKRIVFIVITCTPNNWLDGHLIEKP